tara:strand:+ start:10782 stop:12059 length:1278 start_codon:yes stop_codon:yes gene_type:complete
MVQLNLIQSPSLKTKFKINNKLIMSIKILQMSYEEIQNFIKKEAEKNPFIILKKTKYNQEANNKNINNINVKEWLYQQSSILYNNPIEEKLIETYIENLDNNGFCKISASEAAKTVNCSNMEAINILKKLKELDPIGIFSSSLKELITIQLIKKGDYNKYFKIILNHLDLVASYNIKKLSELCNLKKEEIIDLLKKLKDCKPRPVDSLQEQEINLIIPDIFLSINNKKLKLSINKTNNYEIYLNETYINKIKLHAKSKSKIEIKNFIKENISHSKWLINNLNKRNNTILIITKKILNLQKNFFLNGDDDILPLTHKKISEMTNMHESTISRAVKNKFIKYESKIIPLNYFFSSKIKKSNSSSKSIKNKIKNIIQNHEKINEHISDQKITNMLNKSGIMISRRTVSKYRANENIPNSQIRLRTVKK